MGSVSTSFYPFLEALRPGLRVYIPGGPGEIEGLRRALQAAPERLAGVTLLSAFVPGMNRFDYAALHPDCRVVTVLLPPAMRTSFEDGRTEVLPLTYHGAAAYFRDHPADLALFNLAPGPGGDFSTGAVSDFPPIVAAGARRRFAFVNEAAPAPKEAPLTARSGYEAVIAGSEPLASPPEDAGGAEEARVLRRVARGVADLVPDGARVQTGIGQAPAALFEALEGHRDLRLASGVVTDGFFAALEAGAFAPGGHLAGIAYCRPEGYGRLHHADFIRFADVFTTHAPDPSAAAPLVAVNSALEVDLLGQANLEWRDGRLVSGAGGAPDFAAAALRHPRGRSILALPATARGGRISRIVARLSGPGPSLLRTEADVVVTEHGRAEVRALSTDARARALIGIAAPEFREGLEREWAALRARL